MVTDYSRSAGTLTWGLVLLIGGGVAAMWASTSMSTQGVAVVGGLAAVAGLVMLLLGVHQLATNVDLAARVAQDVLNANAPSGPDPYALDDVEAGPAAAD